MSRVLNNFESVFRIMPLPAIVFDAEGEVRAANAAAVELLWARPTATSGIEFQAVPELFSAAMDFLDGEEVERRAVLELLTREGVGRYELVLRRIEGGEEEAGGVVAMLRPPPLEASPHDPAFRPPRIPTGMGHRVRTPMNGILGMTELLSSTSLTAEQRDLVDTIRTSAESLMGVMNDWVEMASLEEGSFVLRNSPFDPRTCLQEAMTELRTRSADLGVQVECQIGPNVPDELEGDCERLRQAFVNQVLSMIDAGAHGMVRAKVDAGTEPSGKVSLHVTVTCPEPTVAERSSLSVAVRSGSARLASWLSRTLVERMGGGAWAEVDEQGRPTAHLQIEFTEPEESAAGRTTEPTVSVRTRPRLRVLLAEDNGVNRKLAATLLEKWGHYVTTVRTGIQAVDAFARGGFDLVLMDLEMPELDGLQATVEIRKVEKETGRHTPIYALTAHSLGGDPQQCYEVGMDGYIAKPIRAESFRRIVERAVPGGRSEPSQHSNPDVFDYADVLDRLDGEEDLLQQVAAVFLQDSPRTMTELQHAVSRRDPDALVFCAHKIKGALGTLSAHAAHDAASRLERLGKERDFPRASMVLEELRARIDALVPELAASVKRKPAA